MTIPSPTRQAPGPPLTEKCRSWRQAEALRETGLYPYFPAFDRSDGSTARIDGRPVLNFGTNDYQGLTHDPRVVDAAKRALDRFGTSSSGSRLMNGSTALHRELEGKWAAALGKEDAIVFSTGYAVNLGVISALAGPGDRVVVDRESHNSILAGCALSRAEAVRFAHNDPDALDAVLARDGRPALVVAEGVYSTTGESAPLDRIAPVCRDRGATLMIDDAHGFGVSGGGLGTAHRFGVTGLVDLIMVTHSKSVASVGGAVAGDARVIDYIRHHARPFIFTAALPPSCAAAALEALRIIRAEPARVDRLAANADRLRAGVARLGFATVPGSAGPIVPIPIGEEVLAIRVWNACFRRGLYMNPIVPPAVPSRRSLLRASTMVTHTADQIDQALDILDEVGRELGVLPRRGAEVAR